MRNPHIPRLAILMSRQSHRDDHMARVRAARRANPAWTSELLDESRGEIVSTPYTCMPSAWDDEHSSSSVSLLSSLADGLRIVFSDPLIVGMYAFCGGLMFGLLIATRY